MTTFNTRNPIGSSAPKDLHDNAENLDVAVNSTTSDTWVDRFGRTRPTLAAAVDPTGLVQTAVNAADRAETARDAAFVNADVYPDIAAGLAAVAVGKQFQVVEGGEIFRYSKINGTTGELVAVYQGAVDGLFETGVNLINPAEVIAGFVLTGSGKLTESQAGNSASGYIKVEPNTTYHKNYPTPAQIFFYDSSRALIQREEYPEGDFVTLPGCEFIRLNLPGDSLDSVMVSKLAGDKPFEPFGMRFSADLNQRRIDKIEGEIVTGANLLDYDKSLDGMVISTEGTILSSTAGNSLSDYIPVKPNTTYSKNFSTAGGVIAFFDDNKVFISAVEDVQFITPSNCSYIRVNFPKSSSGIAMVYEGVAHRPYEPYANKFKKDLNSLRIDKLEEMFQYSKNLFDKNAITRDMVVRASDGELQESSGNNSVSDFILVEPLTEYTKNTSVAPAHIVFYGEDKRYISGYDTLNTVTTPDRCRYVRFNLKNALADKIQFEIGPITTDYEEYGWKPVGASKGRADIGQSVGVSMSLTEDTSGCRRETEVDDINDIFPFNSIKLCNVKKTEWGSTLITYEGELGFSRGGDNGEVMVEVPKHYLKRFIENGREYIYLSGTPLDGFAIDPAFVENGKEINSIYVGAYDGFIDENGLLRSITGKKATTGVSLPDFRVAANNLGDGFGLLDARTVFMLQRLFMIYFADRNAETSVGLGLVNFPWQSAPETLARATSNSSNTIIVNDAAAIRKFRVGMNVAVIADGTYFQLDDRKITAMNAVGSLTEITFSGPPVDVEEGVTRIYSQTQDSGMTDDVVGSTGMANKLGGFDGTESVKWLHMENLWGNVWNMIDGIVVSDLVCYVGENTSDYSTTVGDEFKATHKPLPLLVPLQDTNKQDDFETNNYFVKNLMLDKLNPAYAPPIQLGDGSNRFSGYCDPFYTRESGANIPAFGGGIDHIFRAGMFVWRFWYTSTSNTRILCGARIMFRPV